MKKFATKICTIVLVLFSFQSLSFAQGFEQGTKNLNLGITLGNSYGFGGAASFDVGINDQISLGVGGTYSSYNYRYLTSNYGINYFSVGGRGAYHLGEVLADPIGWDASKVDPYLGVTLSYFGASYKDNVLSGVNFGGLKFGGLVGFRYGLNDKLGAYAELGFPSQSVGITFKL